MKNPRILIINPFGIGDVIFSTPLIQILRDSYPDSFIGYLCNKRSYEVLKSNPNLNKLFIYEKDDYRSVWNRSKLKYFKMVLDFLMEIRRERFDLLIDLSLAYQYSLLAKFIGIKKRFGFNYRNRGRFLTRKIDIEGFKHKHVIEYYLDVLKLLGLETANKLICPKVYLNGLNASWADNFLKDSGVAEKDILIGVIPGCGASWGKDAVLRRWDREKFAEVCDGMIDKYRAKVVLLGDAKEVPICADMEKLMKHKPIIACGKTSLGDLMGIINRCNLIVTNDGGPLHMAVGLGVRTVSIFGPVNEKVYGPYPPSSRHVALTGDAPCWPCYKNFKYVKCDTQECLKRIKPDDVLAAVDRLMEKS